MDAESGTKLRLLIFDSNRADATRLAAQLHPYGFEAFLRDGSSDIVAVALRIQPTHIVIDPAPHSNLSLSHIPDLLQAVPNVRILVFTLFADIQTAIWAVKAGACDCLAKPSLAGVVGAVLHPKQKSKMLPPECINPYEYRLQFIQSVLIENDFNVTRSARQLGLSRRCLQRLAVCGDVFLRPDGAATLAVEAAE